MAKKPTTTKTVEALKHDEATRKNIPTAGYTDHHDPAYRWAERRKLETHPKPGAAQLLLVLGKVETARTA